MLCVEGCPDAWDLPLWYVQTEAGVARNRLNKTLKTNTVLMLEAMQTARSSGKKGARQAFKAFANTLEQLDG